MLRTVFVALLAGAIFVPFVPIAGPLSGDDVFPLLAVALAGLAAPLSRPRGPVLDASFVAICVFAAVALVSSGANASELGELGRLAGRSAGRMAFYLALVVGTRAVLDAPGWGRRAAVGLSVAAGLQAVFCVFAHRTRYRGPYGIGIADIPTWSVLSGKVRVHGTFSGALGAHELANVSANFLASYLVLSVPVSLGVLVTARRRGARLFWGLAVLAQLLALYLTYTRAALAALAVAILVAGWLLGRRRLAVGAVVLAAATSLALPAMREKFLKEGHNRYALWTSSLRTTATSPLVGVGDGRYLRVMSQDPTLHETDWGVSNATAHNSILLSAAHHGVPGGLAHLALDLALLGVAFACVRRARTAEARRLTAFLAAGVLGWMIQDQFNNLAYVPKVATQLWFVFALLPLVARAGEAPEADATSDPTPAPAPPEDPSLEATAATGVAG
jgi:hypothetical protein